MSSGQNILVTGASGFVGGHLVRAAVARLPNWSLIGWYFGATPPPMPGVRWSAVDIEWAEQVATGIREAEPTHVIHLAAVADVGGSFANPRGTWSINVMGTLNLLEALRQEAPEAKLLLVSSSEVYGDSFKIGNPLGEDAPISPQNPYAASKAAGELLARSYIKAGLRLLIARPFNHIGPGQSEQFAVSSFARQLALIEAGMQPPSIKVGNLNAERDFLDVRDVAEAYILALTRLDSLPSGLVLNLCSGIPRRIGDVLEQLIAVSDIRPRIVQDPARMRPSDIPSAAGRADAAKRHLGWSPMTPWTKTLQCVLDNWRARI